MGSFDNFFFAKQETECLCISGCLAMSFSPVKNSYTCCLISTCWKISKISETQRLKIRVLTPSPFVNRLFKFAVYFLDSNIFTHGSIFKNLNKLFVWWRLNLAALYGLSIVVLRPPQLNISFSQTKHKFLTIFVDK